MFQEEIFLKLIEEIKANFKKNLIISSSGTLKSARCQDNQENLSPKQVSCQVR